MNQQAHRTNLVAVGQNRRVDERKRGRFVPASIRVQRTFVIPARRFVIREVILHKLRRVLGQNIGDAASQLVLPLPSIRQTLRIQLFSKFVTSVRIHRIEITVAQTRLISYIVIAAVPRMRVSIAAALSARPPQPQIPMIPTRFSSKKSSRERKSTAAEKSSVINVR